MLTQNLRDYLIITTFVITAAAIFFIILFNHRKKTFLNSTPSTQKIPQKKQSHVITSHDIRAVSGEDMIATQLDLARAYIEIGKKQLASKMLDHAVKQGNSSQRQEALELLKQL